MDAILICMKQKWNFQKRNKIQKESNQKSTANFYSYISREYTDLSKILIDNFKKGLLHLLEILIFFLIGQCYCSTVC